MLTVHDWLSKAFDKVSILFMNTMDFSTVVNKAEPASVIAFVNATVSVYDSIVATFDKVNKIETKADGSYMVVAGLESKVQIELSQKSQSRSVISRRQQATFDARQSK
jgi:hypothetical protein